MHSEYVSREDCFFDKYINYSMVKGCMMKRSLCGIFTDKISAKFLMYWWSTLQLTGVPVCVPVDIIIKSSIPMILPMDPIMS